MFFELLHPRASISGTQFKYYVPQFGCGSFVLPRTKKLIPEMKTETHSKILFSLAWEAVKPTYNEKTDIHQICQMSLNDAKKDDLIDEDNILPIFGEFGSIVETDNNLSSAFTVEDTIMASNLRTIVPSTVFQLPLSSINISPFLPFCEIPPKPSSTPSSGVFVHSSLITTQTPPPSPSASTSSITSVILPSSQSSTTIFQSSNFPTMHYSLSYQKFEVTVSLPFSSPLIQTAAVTVASPLFQTSAMIVASPLLHTAVLVVSSPRLQTCAMIPSYQSIQTSVYMLPSPTISAEMLASLSPENSAIMLSVLSLRSLWTQAETKTKQHTYSRLSTEPDQLQIQPPQHYIPSININEISFEHSDNGNIKVLGKGATAEVLQGNLHNDCWIKKIAIKLFTNDQHKNVIYISQEARILQILNNSNVTPKVYGIIQNNSFPLCLVEELIENSMELYKLLSNPSITHSAWLHIATNISKSLKVIHDADVLVNDIKSDNIMVNTHDLSIKFIDMGHTSHKEGRSFYLLEADAYKYPHMGPEISCGQTTTKATDIFSLGYLLRMFPTSPLKVQGQLCMHPCPEHRPLIEEVVEYISSHMKQ